jgi:hypothetical protein
MVVLCAAALVAPGCDKKTDAPTGSGGTASAAAKKDDKGKKKPKAKPADAKKTAHKGGDASSDKPPAKDAKKVDDGAMKDKKKVDAAEPAACDDVPDMAAACGGSNLFFCMDKDLYAVDCTAAAKEHGFESGECFETEKQVDCLGCMKLDDGSVACCNAQDDYCCDDQGFCWDDAAGGDDQ